MLPLSNPARKTEFVPPTLKRRLLLGAARFQHANAPIEIRQPDRERQSFAFIAFDSQFAAMLAHDPAHNQQAKSGAGIFRRVIWLEDATERFRRHPATGICETNEHMRVFAVGSDTQDPATLHRFKAILDHVVER